MGERRRSAAASLRASCAARAGPLASPGGERRCLRGGKGAEGREGALGFLPSFLSPPGMGEAGGVLDEGMAPALRGWHPP